MQENISASGVCFDFLKAVDNYLLLLFCKYFKFNFVLFFIVIIFTINTFDFDFKLFDVE